LKKNEIMNDKLGVVAAMEPYLGRYFSAEYVRKHILGQTDSEIIDIDRQIKKEIEKGIIPDPAAMMMQPEMGGQPPAAGQPPAMGAPMQEPEVGNGGMGAGKDIGQI
jgi:hypothetical protein